MPTRHVLHSFAMLSPWRVCCGCGQLAAPAGLCTHTRARALVFATLGLFLPLLLPLPLFILPLQALREFLESFSGFHHDGKVTFPEFEDYYTSLSSMVDNDSFFHLAVWSTWQLDRPHPRAAAADKGTPSAGRAAAGSKIAVDPFT